MAINLVGTQFRDLKNIAYDARSMNLLNLESRMNLSDIVIENIQATSITGRVFAGIYPDMTQIENDICSWF